MHTLLFKTLSANLGMNLFDVFVNFRQWRLVSESNEEPRELRTDSQSSSQNEAYDKIRYTHLKRNETKIFYSFLDLINVTTALYFYFPLNKWKWVSSKVETQIMQPVFYVVYDAVVSELIRFPLNLLIFLGLRETLSIQKPVSLFLIIFIGQAILKITALGLSTYYTTLLLDAFGGNFFIWSWLVWLISASTLTPIYLEFVLPLMEEFGSLQSGRLKRKLELLAGQVNFPTTNIYVTKGTHSDEDHVAYFAGLFNSKAIVISAYLASYMTDDEIVAVVAHEMGHWKLGHSWYYLISRAIYYFGICYFLKTFYGSPEIYDAFMLNTIDVPIHPSASFFIIVSYLLPPFERILRMGLNLTTRKCEFEADAFAKELGHETYLKSALIKMYQKKKIYPVFDITYSVAYLTHPSILERIIALD